MAKDILPDDTIEWMWADAGGYFHAISQINILRWSSIKSPADTASELELPANKKDSGRPVQMKIRRAGAIEHVKFQTVAEACAALNKAALNKAPSPGPQPIAPGVQAVARQADGHAEVVLKNITGGVVKKVANQDMVSLCREGDDAVLVKSSDEIEGWAKSYNLQVDITVCRDPQGGKFEIPLKLSENFDDFKAKVADHESLARHQVQLYKCEHLLDVGAKPGWNIMHRDHITLRLAERQPPPVIRTGCFVCGQITEVVNKKLDEMKPQSLKASMPRFNEPRGGIPYPRNIECIDIPCYGPALTEAIIALFNLDIIRRTARELRFMIPGCSINEVITEKNKVRGPELINAIKLAGGDSASVQKLEQFVQKIQQLKAEDFMVNGRPRTDGKSWVDEYCAPGWRDKLHVDVVLTNFGFTDAFCQSFKGQLLPNSDKETWTAYAVRWLAKAFDVFSFQGSPSDVVNIIYAMLGKQHSPKPIIEDVVKTVKEFTSILRDQDWTRLVWKPSHIIHDSELDDMLAWLLCCSICSNTNSTLVCDVQLPPQTPAGAPPTQIDYLHAQYTARSTSEYCVNVFRDPKSRNQDKVEYSACFVPPKAVYLVSETEMRAFVGEYTWDGEINMFKRGVSRLYLHPVSGCWCVSLDVAGMEHDYFQIRARTKGCLPHNNLGWSMLVRPENNAGNIKAPCPLTWNKPDSNRRPIWQELDPDGVPVLPDGHTYEGPKPVFHFSISRTPLRRAESPPRCLDPSCGLGEPARHDGWTRCKKHHKLGRQWQDCPIYQMARKFIYELNVEEFLVHEWDHCFCSTCHPGKELKDEIIPGRDGKAFQIAPRGWVAFGIVVPRYLPNGVKFQDIWKWPSSFHGTRASLLPHILRHGQIGMPGDRLIGNMDGGVLLSKHCAGRQEAEKFYTSPTIEYAGLQFYAKPRRSESKDPDMKGVVGQVVVQCNQNREPHNLIAQHRETMGFEKNKFPQHGVCKYTPLYDTPRCTCDDCKKIPAEKHAIEVESSRPDLCVVRRVLVRTFKESEPPAKSRWEGNQKLSPIPGQRENFRSPVDRATGTIDGDSIWL